MCSTLQHQVKVIWVRYLETVTGTIHFIKYIKIKFILQITIALSQIKQR